MLLFRYTNKCSAKNGPLVKRPKTPPFHGGNTGSNPVWVTKTRAISSAGRAPALQAGCRQFDPVIAHQFDIRSLRFEARKNLRAWL